MGRKEQSKGLRTLLDSCLIRYFGIQDADFHDFIEDNAEYLDLTSGDVLIRQGEICDAVYFLLSGHLRAIVDMPDGRSVPVGEIGRGETVGELALFTGKARGANVLAIRDSIVVKIQSPIIEKAIGKKPQVALKITRQIIERYDRAQAITTPPAVPVNVTILPITEGVDVKGFITRFMNIRKAKDENICIIDSEYVAQKLGGLDTPDIALPRGNVSLALSDLELKHSGLFFVAEPKDSAWCHTAVHHSDEVILLANAKASPNVTQIEKDLLKGHANLRAQTTLVLLHEDDTQSPRGTSLWLDPRNVSRHFHIRKTYAPDYRRLNRIISGKATGLVLAGGGARGMAHLGVMTALGEAGLEFDFIGGTSAGAIMGSFAAMDAELKNLKSITRDIFVNSPFGNISGDYNLPPLLSLIKGERAWQVSHKAVLDNAGADIDLEDSWITFFAVASNFTTHQEEVLTRGNFAKNVVASFSIPGLMPPSLINGDLLFDGGSFNNFPVDHMRKLGASHIIGVDLLPDVVRKNDLERLPNTSSLLWDKLRGRKKQKYRKLPSLPNTLLTASVVTSMAKQKQLREHVDILFQPDTRGVGLLDWKKYDLIFERAKDDATEQLAATNASTLNPFKGAID